MDISEISEWQRRDSYRTGGHPESWTSPFDGAHVERVTTRLQDAGERRSRSMRFLVTIDGSDAGVGMPPERLAQVQDQMVIPGVQKPAQWE